MNLDNVVVTWQDKPVHWNPYLEKLFHSSVSILYSGDDWDSLSDKWSETSPEFKNRLRSIWYVGYITRARGLVRGMLNEY